MRCRAPDVSFFTSIKSKLVSDGCVVPSRVFSLGYSNGGFMTHRIACESANSGSNLVAAAALHSGAHGDYDGVYANGPWNSCNSATHIPVIGFHGTSDKTVPFNGGKNPSPWGTAVWGSFYQTMGIWSAQNQVACVLDLRC
jgi:polyhydroxybutyrate depolymerase